MHRLSDHERIMVKKIFANFLIVLGFYLVSSFPTIIEKSESRIIFTPVEGVVWGEQMEYRKGKLDNQSIDELFKQSFCFVSKNISHLQFVLISNGQTREI